MNRPRGVDDQVAAEEADGGGSAVHLPQFGLYRVGDQLDDFIRAILLRSGFVLAAVSTVGILEQALPAAATATATLPAATALALPGILQAQVRRVGVSFG